MNEEIKEILIKDFNEILVKEFCTDWKEKRLYIELLVNSTPFSNLLNYITNLQKENVELKDTIKKDNHLLGCNFSKKDKYKQERDIYKQRNEKAIEYIKSHKPSDIGICGNNKKYYYTLNEDSVDNLLNILEGGDE